ITDEFMVSVKPNASITGHPQDEVAYENDTVTFNLAVTGALPIYYQWQKNGENIPGAVYNVYPIYGVQLSDSGYYRCIVSNDCNVDTTLEAKLTVLPASGINEKSGYNSILIFPNPVQDYLKISFKHKIRSAEYKIFNQGGILKTYGKIYGKNNYEIDTKLLNPGIYILHISENDNSHYMKFLKL
ncbi:MAG: T9SS type A sorting domain-containing protein, partial [Bacteroidales bacterium]|nr:T9SS type A sorting domain-containing protein [Bacteroidales bacterium]